MHTTYTHAVVCICGNCIRQPRFNPIIILGVLLLMFTACSHKPLVLAIGTAAADVVSTHVSLSRGNVETNRLLGERPSVAATISLKAIGLTGLYLVDRYVLKRRHRLLLYGPVIGLQGWATMRNVMIRRE